MGREDIEIVFFSFHRKNDQDESLMEQSSIIPQ